MNPDYHESVPLNYSITTRNFFKSSRYISQLLAAGIADAKQFSKAYGFPTSTDLKGKYSIKEGVIAGRPIQYKQQS